jgi:hypothetical protein
MAALLKTRRGQQMGELGLAEVLLAERMMHDAFRADDRTDRCPSRHHQDPDRQSSIVDRR